MPMVSDELLVIMECEHFRFIFSTETSTLDTKATL